jgi:hypothetical protein
MTKIGSLLIFAVLFMGVSASAAVKVTATVDRNEISEGDPFIYSINVSADGGNPQIDSEPQLPDLSGLSLINSTSSTESRSSFVNGKFTVQQTRSFDYQISAPRKGVFKIGASKVVVDGKQYSTEPIKITVNAGAGGGRIPPQARGRGQPQQPNQNPGDDVDDMEDMFNRLMQRHLGGRGGQGQAAVNPNEAFFIQVDVDKEKAYAGEQVTASWYLYTRGQIADIDTLKYPDLKGFWKEELEMATRLNFQQAIVNGAVWQKALLVSYALFPIKAGKSTIDPYRAKCTVVVGGPFGFGKAYPFTKASKPIIVDVAEVPAAGRPPEFSGAVGNFQVNATLDQNSVAANQPVTLKLKFSGRGNAKLIDLPPLDLPKSIELYSQKADAKFFKDGTSYKEFEILLIPREPGQLEIPSIKAAYFDPQKQKFESIASNKLVLMVTPGKPGETPQLPSQAGKPEGAANPDVLTMPAPALLTEGGVVTLGATSKILWMIVYAALAGLLGFRAYFTLLRKPKRENLEAALKRRMKTVSSQISAGDYRKTGVELTNLIYLILGQITEQGGANLEFQKLMDAASPSLRRELTGPLRAVLDRAEQLSFAPEKVLGDAKNKADLNKLRQDTEKVLMKAIALSARANSEVPSGQKSTT